MLQPLPTRLARAARDDGLLRTSARCLGWGAAYLRGLPGAGRDDGRAFEFAGQRIPYLSHRYNRTWLNERAVEVPLALRALGRADGEVLEVGNVLAHYGAGRHTVVDRYERAPGVINEDVATYDPGDRRFDLIVSVSTLEHVGHDEEPRDPDKPLRAVRALSRLLAPGGRLWASVPTGYNPALDEHFRAGRTPFDEIRALRRAGRGLDWREAEPREALDAPYDHLVCAAAAVLICELRQPPGEPRERR